MSYYRRQHWLPNCYLKLFRCNENGKKAFIYRFDGRKLIKVPTKSQCYKKFFFLPFFVLPSSIFLSSYELPFNV